VTASLVSIPLFGGLGNQLFGAAFGLYLHRKYGLQVEHRYPPTGFGNVSHGDAVGRAFSDFDDSVSNFVTESRTSAALRVLRNALLQDRSIGKGPNGRYCSEAELISRLERRAMLPKRVTVSGLFQRRTYVDYLQANNFFTQLAPRDLSAKATQLSREISHQNTYAVHIRRGDYLTKSKNGALDPNYYLVALRDLGAELSSQVFVFTDSEDYVRHEFSRLGTGFSLNFDCNSGLSPAETLHVMSHAKSLVTSKSTFSWWAATLGRVGKQVVFPLGWNSHLVSEDWILRNAEDHVL